MFCQNWIHAIEPLKSEAKNIHFLIYCLFFCVYVSPSLSVCLSVLFSLTLVDFSDLLIQSTVRSWLFFTLYLPQASIMGCQTWQKNKFIYTRWPVIHGCVLLLPLPFYACTATCTAKVTFYKIPENTTMFVWSSSI